MGCATRFTTAVTSRNCRQNGRSAASNVVGFARIASECSGSTRAIREISAWSVIGPSLDERQRRARGRGLVAGAVHVVPVPAVVLGVVLAVRARDDLAVHEALADAVQAGLAADR